MLVWLKKTCPFFKICSRSCEATVTQRRRGVAASNAYTLILYTSDSLEKYIGNHKTLIFFINHVKALKKKGVNSSSNV